MRELRRPAILRALMGAGLLAAIISVRPRVGGCGMTFPGAQRAVYGDLGSGRPRGAAKLKLGCAAFLARFGVACHARAITAAPVSSRVVRTSVVAMKRTSSGSLFAITAH